jgi:peroxiredoxin
MPKLWMAGTRSFCATLLLMIGADALGAAAESSLAEGPSALAPHELGIGRLVPDLEMRPVNRKAFRLSELKPKSAIVIAFTSTTCPVANRYAPTLAALEKQYGPDGTKFIFVDPLSSDADADIKKAARTHGFRGAYVHDSQGRIAAALGARSTTEVFVLDAARTLVYRGAIDDQYGLGYSQNAPRHTYLVDALNALVTNGLPAVQATTAPGCSLGTSSSSKTEFTSVPLTYHARISRILQEHCLECHHADGVAPFALETYQQARSHAGMIRKQVERGAMPPWFAAPADSASGHSIWANDRTLPAADKADLLAWVSGKLAEGDAADSPLPRKYSSDWEIGAPDAVVRIPQPIEINAMGKMPYQNIFVPTDFGEDKWVSAIEVLPTARDVVHHALVYVVPAERVEQARKSRRDTDSGNFFAAYVPGNNLARFPDGFGKLIPKGATLHFQIHYTPKGTATRDQTAVGLRFAKAPPQHEVRVAAIAAKLDIPPGDPNYEAHGSVPVLFDARIMSYMPHMHMRGKAYRYELRHPDGKTELLLEVPRYDFNWQLQYCLADFVNAPAGSSLLGTAWYDNSTNNPANPDPERRVRWGEQTDDEMMLGYFEYYVPSMIATNKQTSIADLAWRDGGLVFNGLDKNHDGVITIDESPSAEQFREADADHDGRVTREEFKGFWQRQRAKRADAKTQSTKTAE